jgi:hypothetical protein
MGWREKRHKRDTQRNKKTVKEPSHTREKKRESKKQEAEFERNQREKTKTEQTQSN